MGGGGSAPAAPAQQTVTQTNIPDWLRPQVETTVGGAMQQLFNTSVDPTTGQQTITGVKPYTPYGAGGGGGGTFNPMTGQYDLSQGAGTGAGAGPDAMQTAQAAVAGYSPLQQQAMQGIAGLQTPDQYGAASNAALAATMGALGTQYYSPQYTNQFQAPGQYQPTSTGFQNVSAPDLTTYQMPGVQNVRTGSFANPYTAQSYMNPYLQSALAPQMALLGQQQAQQGQQLASQASQAGAFGGSRYGIQQGLQNQANQLAMSNLVGQGYNQAYNQAAQQYSTDAARQLQAQMANQQAGLTTQQQNLAAALGVQSLGAGQNLQSQLANQAAQQAANQLAAQQAQFGYGQQMTAAQQAAQYGLSAQQLAAQQQQFGAGLGLQGLQTGLQGAGQLAGIGGQQLGAQSGILGLQQQTGALQQQQQQNIINQALQNYATAQQYPLQQYNAYNAILRGYAVPGSTTTTYQAAPSMASQLAGLGTAGIAAAQLSQLPGAKKGGVIKNKAGSGIDSLALKKALEEA